MRFCISLVAILAITFIYVSCNKHTIQKPVGISDRTLSGWSHSDDPQQRTQLTFDDSMQVVREETGNEISSYQFTKDSVIIREFHKDENRYVYEFKGRLDGKKRLLSGTAFSSYVTTAPDTVHQFFTYNKAGALSMEKRISNLTDTFVVTYEYEDNVVAKVKTYSNGQLYNTKEYTYYDDELSNGLPEEVKFRKNVNNLVGVAGHKLIRKITSIGGNGKEKYKLNYEYQMDGNGYASKMITKRGKKVSGVMTYFYVPTTNDLNKSLASK